MREPHLIAAGWRLWSIAVLRSAGLPISLLERLDAPEEAREIDRWISLAERVSQDRERAIAACIAALEQTPREERRSLQKLLSKLKKGGLPKADAPGDPLTALVASTNDSTRQRSLLEALDRNTRLGVSERLREIARLDSFREALIWQNRSALTAGVDRLLDRTVEASDAKTRGQELMVASYVQRYATKNETIGAFGPIGWAEIADSPLYAEVAPGEQLIAERKVFFEPWAVHAIAEKLEDQIELRRHLAPRRHPALIVREGRVTLRGRDRELPPEIVRLLELCDGAATAETIAQLLLQEYAGIFDESPDVFERMEELDRMSAIVWRFDRATSSATPEVSLRNELEKMPGSETALRELDALLSLRAEVAAASSSDRTNDRMAALQSHFVELTGKDATRKSGQIYAGRTLLYFDARRDVHAVLGKKFLDRLGPLVPVLQSARWFTWEIARRYRLALDAVFDQLGGDRVDLVRFWDHAAPLFDAPAAQPTEIVRSVQRELEARWRSILEFDGKTRHFTADPQRTSELAAAAFAAPAPGWPSARHHSPDLMIAAESPAALAKGDFLIVLGETHAGMNTVTSPFMLELQPDRDALIRQREQDLRRANVAPVWSENRSRADFWSLSRHDFDLELGSARSARPKEQVLRSGELELIRDGGTLSVRAPARGISFDCIAFFEHWLIAAAHGAFHLLPKEAHVPRVTIGELVVARESWTVDPASLAFAQEAERLDRWIGARVWARSLGAPRWIFASVPEEQKPTFIDLESPIFVELFTKLIRKASALRVVEMLPRPDQLWLTDAEGYRYTSELRFASVDPVSWSPPPTPT